MIRQIDDIPELVLPTGADGCPGRNVAHGYQQEPVMRLNAAGLETPLILFSDPEAIDVILTDDATFVSNLGPQARRFDSDYSPETAAIYDERGLKLVPVLAWANGEDHKRQRRLVDKAFFPGKVERKKIEIRRFASELIAAFPKGEAVEFMQSFAMRLPTMVILHELGLPHDHIDFMIDVTNRAAPMLDFTSTDEQMNDGARAVSDLEALLLERIEAVRSAPDETLLSDMVHAKSEEYSPLSRDELLSSCVELLLGGSHTTMAMLGWSMFTLATKPEIAQSLREDRQKIPTFVEEVLRRRNTIVTSYRTASRDVEIGGVFLPEGTQIAVRLDCANRDGKLWEEAEEFVLDRPRAKRHHAFGRGKHTCIGNGLARGELTVAIDLMIDRFAEITLAQPADMLKLVPSFDGYVLAELKLNLR